MRYKEVKYALLKNGSSDLSSAETALAGAFSGPVFSTNRGFMRGGRGGGRGMRGEMRGINNGNDITYELN